jgi:hypothetical protein
VTPCSAPVRSSRTEKSASPTSRTRNAPSEVSQETRRSSGRHEVPAPERNPGPPTRTSRERHRTCDGARQALGTFDGTPASPLTRAGMDRAALSPTARPPTASRPRAPRVRTCAPVPARAR